MTQNNWTASGTGDWATNADWSLGSPPMSGQDAYIGTGSGGTVTSSVDETVASIGVAAGYVLDINGNSTFTATSGTGPNAIVGSITIDGSTSKAGSTIANDGFITLLGAASSQAKIEVSGNLTIASVGGQIQLRGSGPADDVIVSDGHLATLNLNGGLLSGGGTVGDANLTVNIAAGSLVVADGQTLIFNTLSNTVSNAGTMETANGGVLEIDSPLDNTHGTIVAKAGTVLINSVVSNGAGVVSVGLGSTLDILPGGSIIGDV